MPLGSTASIESFLTTEGSASRPLGRLRFSVGRLKGKSNKEIVLIFFRSSGGIWEKDRYTSDPPS